MPTYRVYYKGYYHEYSEFEHADVEAADELSALREFFKQRRSELREADLLEGAQLPTLARLSVSGEYRWWEGDWLRALAARRPEADPEEIRHREIEWEEEVEAGNPAQALDAFFREHVTDRTQVMWLGGKGPRHETQGLDCDPGT